MSNTLAQAYPDTPHCVWIWLFWFSVALISPFPLWLVWHVYMKLEFAWPIRWKKTPVDFREAEVLIHSAIQPSVDELRNVIRWINDKIAAHQNTAIRSLISAVRRGSEEPILLQEKRLIDTFSWRMPLGSYTIDDLIGFFRNEYRQAILFIKDANPLVLECGENLKNELIFKQWIRADEELRRELRKYCNQPQHTKLRDVIKNHGWNENVMESLHEGLLRDKE